MLDLKKQELPHFIRVRQHFPTDCISDIPAAVRQELDKLTLDLIDRHVCRHGQHKGGRLQQFCVMDIGLPDTVTQMQRQIDRSWRQYGMQRPFDFW